ncbi:class I SAM-dependent methyltransferase [Dactylosporangium sucinum]|uniref:Methyltransferase domain-containing protein n=1 Tax=Dactylosporangium sucinum TaxID=1424081 RepID=A0A917U404_9ACTN|nr:class I SAM-dependent methyltransferase [Dactylosporangium sucinum]GGM56245.1 hypothetical protein GCM10007977_067430 [Dactylosporangium sucinum]
MSPTNAWAVRLVAPGPADRILEIGCGSGLATARIADALTTGRVTAIDRSATAVARASSRNADAIAAGRAHVVQATLAEFTAAEGFAKVLAVNVNLFWTGPSAGELASLSRLLAPSGTAWLCYDTPSRGAAERAAANLFAAGFTTETFAGPTPSSFCITVSHVPPTS